MMGQSEQSGGRLTSVIRLLKGVVLHISIYRGSYSVSAYLGAYGVKTVKIISQIHP